jgi:hypothetical protein
MEDEQSRSDELGRPQVGGGSKPEVWVHGARRQESVSNAVPGVASGRPHESEGSLQGHAEAEAAALPPVSVFELVTQDVPIPGNLGPLYKAFRGQDGHAYILDPRISLAHRVGSRGANAILAGIANSRRSPFRTRELSEVNEALRAWVDQYGERLNVWYRVAPSEPWPSIEIDPGHDQETRIRITAGAVTLGKADSGVTFYRTSNTRAMVCPAIVGNLDLLTKYVNLSATDHLLFVAWLSYTLAHPKVSTSKYPILVLQGGQGSGKTSLCNNVILRLIDPSAIGVQRMPPNEKDLAIAVQNAHVVAFDNVRGFKSSISDLFCTVATGGQLVSRQLYTDAEQSVLHLHGALVLNGIHSFVNQSDLAQRCLTLQLRPIPDDRRQSDADMTRVLEQDLPAIQRGLFDLIASVFEHLPTAKVQKTERMIDFVRWLAAMEAAHGAPPGVYQLEYSEVMQQGQLDSLLDNLLASSILGFIDEQKDGRWSGTPGALLDLLSASLTPQAVRSRDWPTNPISLSKRLVGLQASLLTQGISIESSRGRQRTLTITKLEGRDD